MSELSPTERAALLGIARGSILGHLGVAPAPALPDSGSLAEARGAFVTLHVGDALRGCVGTFRPEGSLAATVARMAVSAAKEDPRFPPLRPDEIAELRVAVSVLTPPHRLDDRRAVKVGTHGVLVRRGWHRGALLPKVALEQGWDAETFLSRCCLKAGLPARAWQEPETEVEVFEADEFGEGAES
ncbi:MULTISPECIES: AmmeMemoRadiSam system protein A [unclassified Anaeromyxobacter]|uniref:AmmeMemoRadiSam system protein A n=1 Tax=unclassified Anaeromyxobacter TaxID=2620896 RepID=UPI001F573CC3|nr:MULTISPECIES: AmmeMemoRadiSam system protein A [unclassified Anaeromyxobacter]